MNAFRLAVSLGVSLLAIQVPAQDAAPVDRNAINTSARPGDMMADSPVVFPKQGALPAKFPPDVKERTEPAEEGYYIFSSPCRSLEQIAAIQKDMPAGQFTAPPADWEPLSRARRILSEGGTLRLMAVGDSIVNDTMRSGWVAKVAEAFPKAKLETTVYVRGGGGCQHYKEQNRVPRIIVPHKPDVVFIGGISQQDIASIREVIHQLRAALPQVEILLATGAFGTADPRDAATLSKAPHSGAGEYGRDLHALAKAENCAYLDLTTPWAEYIRSSGLHPHRFYRDVVHANEYGEQILGKIMLAFWTAPAAEITAPVPHSERVIAFYYPWYGNPKTDGRWANWNHPVAVRNEPPRSFPGGEDIGANFYPSLGAYSVNDPAVLAQHMSNLRQAGVGVICASWWGPGTFTDQALPGLFKAAEAAGIRINFHIEPYPGRNASNVRASIEGLMKRFGESPALHRLPLRGNRPMFFVYDSYLTQATNWASILKRDGRETIRGTAADAVVIGLWVRANEERFMIDGGFDGFYTYFATDGFTYGSTLKNWPKLMEWSRAKGMLFVPCVAPGYIDTRIRPWNGVNTRDREGGAYYDRSWSAAVALSPELVAITTFNEWHEGTQIEPAQPKAISGFNYLDYGKLPQDYYLDRTAHWVRQLK